MTKLVSRADLVAQYNALALKAGKPVVKDFKSKAMAETRIAELVKAEADQATAVAEAQALLDSASAVDRDPVAPIERAPVSPVADTVAEQQGDLTTRYFNEGILAVADWPATEMVAVLLFNNDNTAQWHVTEVLQAGGLNGDEAEEITYAAHEEGSSVVKVLPKPAAVELFKKLYDKVISLSQQTLYRCEYVKELRFVLEVRSEQAPATPGVAQ